MTPPPGSRIVPLAPLVGRGVCGDCLAAGVAVFHGPQLLLGLEQAAAVLLVKVQVEGLGNASALSVLQAPPRPLCGSLSPPAAPCRP